MAGFNPTTLKSKIAALMAKVEAPAEPSAPTPSSGSSRGGFTNIHTLNGVQTQVAVPPQDHTLEMVAIMNSLEQGVTFALGRADGVHAELVGFRDGVCEALTGIRGDVVGLRVASDAHNRTVDARFGALDAHLAAQKADMDAFKAAQNADMGAHLAAQKADVDARFAAAAAAAKSAPLPRAKPASRPAFNPAEHPCHPAKCLGPSCLFDHTGSDEERRLKYAQAGAEVEAEKQKATPAEIAQAAKEIAALRASARAQRGKGGK